MFFGDYPATFIIFDHSQSGGLWPVITQPAYLGVCDRDHLNLYIWGSVTGSPLPQPAHPQVCVQ